MRKLPIILGALAVVVISLMSSIFIVDEREQALVLRFGQVQQVKTDPGLGFKLPLVDEVARYEGRILPLETSALEVTPLDERRLVVDAFARWRIADVQRFRQAATNGADRGRPARRHPSGATPGPCSVACALTMCSHPSGRC